MLSALSIAHVAAVQVFQEVLSYLIGQFTPARTPSVNESRQSYSSLDLQGSHYLALFLDLEIKEKLCWIAVDPVYIRMGALLVE